MAVREFDGVDDNIVCATGGLSGMTHGTVIVLAQRRDSGDFYALMGVNDSGNALLGSVLIWNNNTWAWFTSGAGSKGQNAPINGWSLVIVRKATGSATPRFSVYTYATGTWDHQAGTAAQGDWTAPGAGGNIAFSDAANDFPAIRVAARAAWANTLPWSADTTGDAAIEAAGLETAYQNWLDASPDAAWRFNQDSVSTAVADDTGGGAGQTSITGTTVVTGDDPPGFDMSVGSAILGTGWGAGRGSVSTAKVGTGGGVGFGGGAGYVTAVSSGTRITSAVLSLGGAGRGVAAKLAGVRAGLPVGGSAGLVSSKVAAAGGRLSGGGSLFVPVSRSAAIRGRLLAGGSLGLAVSKLVGVVGRVWGGVFGSHNPTEVAPTPADRVVVVSAGVRTSVVSAESRVSVVPAEVGG